MRGRPRNKGPNPLTRSFESNGPDVKIRGTSQHIADKYSQLARDAQASGDPVAAENYFQHAEHYYRLIAAAQEQYRQQFPASQRDEEGEEGDEEGFGGSADRNQGGEDYDAPPNFPQGGYEQRDRQGGYDQPRGGGGYDQQRDRQQGRFDRNDRPNQNRQRFDRNGERYDRNPQGGDRNQERGERQGGEQRFDRQNGYDRPSGYERQDRPDRQERSERQERRPREDRGNREGYAPREARPERESRRDNRSAGYATDDQGDDAQETGGNLPAFLTTPVRAAPPPASVDEVAESTGLAPAPREQEEPEATGIRPRKRRTRKADPAPESVDETADGA